MFQISWSHRYIRPTALSLTKFRGVLTGIFSAFRPVGAEYVKTGHRPVRNIPSQHKPRRGGIILLILLGSSQEILVDILLEGVLILFAYRNIYLAIENYPASLND